MTTRTREVGEFCWINILTPTPDAARAFYAELLGWTFKDMAGLGYVVRVNGRDIGGLFDLHGMNTPKGATPGIGVMVKVDDAAATGDRVRALGGTAKEPFDIMGQGIMATCHDPNGAEFDLWQPKRMHGFDVDSRAHGAPYWFETISSDTQRAIAFYTTLFGWRANTEHMPGDYDYTVFSQGSRDVGGLMAVPAGKHLPPHWGVYFTVNDIDEAAGKSAGLGGALCVPVRDIPNVGRFCGIVSPHGVTFYAIEHTK